MEGDGRPKKPVSVAQAPLAVWRARLGNGVEVMALVQVHRDGDSESCDER